MKGLNDSRTHFWHIRSKNYDKLFWVNDMSYLHLIKKMGGFQKKDIVLDVGSGTGVVARYLKDNVKHIICIDISSSMLSQGKWNDISLIKWDISDRLFVDNLFDKIVARMVFHHIINDLDRALVRCHDLLKKNGKLIIAEGIPPSDEEDVVKWYSDMFKLKEERITFRENDLLNMLKDNGFKNIKKVLHLNENFSIKNWLINSGLNKKTQEKIFSIHLDANEKIKKLYNMRFKDNDCIVTTKNLILIASK
jgi:ubiquinone/menaquinone biosynthesis C-methylase UbiE